MIIIIGSSKYGGAERVGRGRTFGGKYDETSSRENSTPPTGAPKPTYYNESKVNNTIYRPTITKEFYRQCGRSGSREQLALLDLVELVLGEVLRRDVRHAAADVDEGTLGSDMQPGTHREDHTEDLYPFGSIMARLYNDRSETSDTTRRQPTRRCGDLGDESPNAEVAFHHKATKDHLPTHPSQNIY